MTRLWALLALAVVSLGTPAIALDFDLPGKAELTRELDRDVDTYFLPVAPYTDGRVPARELEGRVVRQAWRLSDAEITTLGLLQTIREELALGGYQVLLDCTDEECGGFDFRFGIDVLPAPDMFVDLFDFKFISAQNAAADGAQFVSALVSRAGDAWYVQLVLVGMDVPVVSTFAPVVQPEEEEPVPVPVPVLEPAPQAASLVEILITQGFVDLPDLVFETGSSTLEEGRYASLEDLAAFLKEDPSRRVALVGHTDAIGGLETNMTLSRARAASVLARLVDDHEVPRAQMESNGISYLSPVAPNTTPEGRRANRRVEAVLLNTE